MSQSSLSSLSTSLKPTMEAHQLPSECYPPTDSDDESFVVLETDCDGHVPSMLDIKSELFQSQIIDESLEQASEAIMKSLTLQSLPVVPKMESSFAGKSFDSSTTNDELQQRIESLIEANRKLSDSLNQNNIVMKNQFETLSKWQEDVERVHDSHKKKFAETKDYIKQLQQENTRLKKMLISSTKPTKIIAVPQVNKSAEDVSTSMESLKEDSKELEQLKRELENQKQLNAQLSLQTSVESEQLKLELESAKHRNAEQALEIDALKANMATLTTVNSLQSIELHNIRTELTSLKDDTSKQSGEMDDMKNELEKEKSLMSQQSNEADLLKEELQKLKEDLVSLQQQNDAQAADLDAKSLLADQLEDFKKQVKENDEEFKLLEFEHLEGCKKEQKLLEEITILKCKLVKLRDDETTEFQHLRHQLSSSQSLITELKESKKVIEMEAGQNRQKIDELDKKLKEAISDQDKLMALEQQLVIYRGDFESERELKMRAIEELNKISEDLSKVQQRNRDLIDEIDELRRVKEEYVEIPRAENAQKTPSPPLTQFSCPLCDERFRSLRAVEEHVDMCIDKAP